MWDGLLHGHCNSTNGWDNTWMLFYGWLIVVWSCVAWWGAWDGGAVYGLTE